MAKQTISKFVSLGGIGLLVIILGFILLVVAAPLFAPNTGGFVFSVSRRAFTIALVAFLMVVAAALVFFARALRRRQLN
jgi:membrane protein implicated in regulation of membrane protease activity